MRWRKQQQSCPRNCTCKLQLQFDYSWFFKCRIAKPELRFDGLYVIENKNEICGAGRGSRTPKGRSPADFESYVRTRL